MSSAGPGLDIAVVIPCLDGERYLLEALASACEQDPPPVDVLVVDNGSRDGSRQLAESYGGPVRCVSEPRRGAAVACNRGVRETEAELVAFLDADDLWTPAKLRLQGEVLRRDPGVAMVFGHVEEFLSPELEGELRDTVHVAAEPQPARLPSNALIRRSVLASVGPFDESLRAGFFVDWQMRAREAGAEAVVLPDLLLRRRIHDRNLGRQKAPRRDFLEVARRALAARRKDSLKPTTGATRPGGEDRT